MLKLCPYGQYVLGLPFSGTRLFNFRRRRKYGVRIVYLYESCTRFTRYIPVALGFMGLNGGKIYVYFGIASVCVTRILGLRLWSFRRYWR